MSERALRIGLPLGVLALVVLLWHVVVHLFAIPPYVLPGPGLVATTLVSDGGLLWHSLLVTLATTFEGFVLAAVGGVGLAILFSQSRLIEYSLYPYAVILQVTPVVAVAPLLLIYLPQPLAVLACAWIVAFFPVLANTTLGLASVDHNLIALFELYKAHALADVVAAQAPRGPAADAGRLAHRRRAVVDRRGGRRNCRGLGRRRLRPCLSHRRERLPPQHPAHVRGAAAALGCGCGHLLCAVAVELPLPPPLARKCRAPRSLILRRDPQQRHHDYDLDQAAVETEGQHGGGRGENGGMRVERGGIEGEPA